MKERYVTWRFPQDIWFYWVSLFFFISFDILFFFVLFAYFLQLWFAHTNSEFFWLQNDEKFHCSETGYHVPLKCTEIKHSDKEQNKNKVNRRLSSLPKLPTIVQKHLFDAINNYKVRKLLDDSVKQEIRNQSYITYRSCVPVIGEEKLSVFGFEVWNFTLLLIKASI